MILRLEGDRLPSVVGEMEVAEGGRLIPVGMSVWRMEEDGVTVFRVGD
ncbi:MAG: hypothetical protein HQK87_11820 [Nitrospinae bacterium]|nr:hypothetical protein [Nitrospinota bacterium]